MNTVKTILFVENDPVALEMYRNRLLREGFHVESAQDGLEALKALSQLTPDLVVLDMMLPKLGGGDVLRFIRSDNRLKTLPVVIFSNAPMTEPAQEFAIGGPTRRLLKSDCTFPMLLQTIQELLIAVSAAAGPGGDTAGQAPANKGLVDVSFPVRNEASKGSTEFLSEALSEIPKIREHCFAYIKSPASPAGLQHLPNLYQRVHFLSTNAGKAGCARVALLANAFDTLLSEIMVKPSWVTPSVLQTIAQAVDCLGFLLKSNAADLAQPMPQARVLAVDDDAVCNHVIVNTLKRANFDAKSVDDPLVALQVLQSTQFDLILLDINMPDLTGFEVCEKLRRFPHCKTTPVIFITGHNNFDNRKQSVLSGGHDFITKPVSPSELALKATIHLLKVRVQRSAPQPAAEPGAAGLSKDVFEAENPIRRISPGNGPVQTSVPASALLPTTESKTDGLAAYPSSASPRSQSVSEDIFQPANSIQILQPGVSRADSVTDSTFVRINDARSPAPETPASSKTNPHSNQQPSIRISGGMFGSAGSVTDSQSAPGPAQDQSFPEGFLPSSDPSPADSQPGYFTPESVSPPEVGLPPISEEVLQHFTTAGAETELRGQVETARAAASQSESALKEKEAELVALQQVRDEFQGKLAVELETTAKAQQELKDLQERLNRSTAELEQVRAGIDKETNEKTRLESELRGQVETARAAASQSESALKEKETELAALLQVRDEFQGKLTVEQETTAKAQRELKELQDRLNRSTAELEQVRAGIDKETNEKTRLESELRGQVETARAAASQSESALKEKETEFAALLQVRDEFQGKLTVEQETTAKAQQELKELQERLNRSTAELEQVRAGVDKETNEKTRLESELRGQVETARAAASQSESALKEKETELAALLQVRDEFQGKLTVEQETTAKAQRELKELQERLNRSTAELEQVRAGIDKETNEKTRLESELRGQVETARAAASQSESALKEKESEFAALLQVRDEFQGKLTVEQETTAKAQQELKELQERLNRSTAELEQVQAGVDKETSEKTRLESELRGQVETARAAASQSESALKEKETELAALLQVRDEFQGKLTVEQEAAAKAQRESKDLQERLNRSTAELEQVKAKIDKESAERTQQEADLREQLETSKTAAGQTATFLKEKDAWCNELEEELTRLMQERDEFQGKLAVEREATSKAQQGLKDLQERLNRSSTELEQVKAGMGNENGLVALQQVRDEFQGKLAVELETTAKAQRELKDLQERLNRSTAELEQVRAGIDKETSEKTRLESELRGQVETARAAASQSESALKEKETEFAALLQVRDEFQGKLTVEQETTAKAQRELKDLQERLNRSTAELEQVRAGIDKETSEKTRLESELRGQVETARAAASQSESALKEKETELAALLQVRDEFQGKLTVEQEAAAKAQQELKDLQERLNRSTAELEQVRAGIDKETSEKTRLESENRNLAEAKEALDLELRQARESLTSWEAEFRDKQKKIAESLRENVVELEKSLESQPARTHG